MHAWGEQVTEWQVTMEASWGRWGLAALGHRSVSRKSIGPLTMFDGKELKPPETKR